MASAVAPPATSLSKPKEATPATKKIDLAQGFTTKAYMKNTKVTDCEEGSQESLNQVAACFIRLRLHLRQEP